MNTTLQTEFLKLIETRRSIRAYEPTPVPENLLQSILQAGMYAPTGGGRQSPTIVAITSKEVRDQLSKYNAKVMHTQSDPYYGAPVILVVLADPKSSTFVEDGSCVLENMMLAAHALGLGSVWVHREREIFDSEEGKALLRTWGLDQTLRGVGSIALGYAAAPASPAAPRKENYAIIV